MPKVGLPSLSHWMECGRVTSQRIYAESKVVANLQCLKRDLGPWPIRQRGWVKSHACTQFSEDLRDLMAGCSQLLSRFKSWLDSKRWTPDLWNGSEWTKKGHGLDGLFNSLRYMKGNCPYMLDPLCRAQKGSQLFRCQDDIILGPQQPILAQANILTGHDTVLFQMPLSIVAGYGGGVRRRYWVSLKRVGPFLNPWGRYWRCVGLLFLAMLGPK